MSSLSDEWFSKFKEQVNLQLDAKDAEIESLQSKLQAAEKETEAAKQAWRDDREETKRERNEALKERDAALLRLDSVTALAEARGNEMLKQDAELSAERSARVAAEGRLQACEKERLDLLARVGYAEGAGEEGLRRWEAAEERLISALRIIHDLFGAPADSPAWRTAAAFERNHGRLVEKVSTNPCPYCGGDDNTKCPCGGIF